MDDFTKRMLRCGKSPEVTQAKSPTKDTRKFLRRFSGTLSVLYFLIFAGCVANIIILLRENPGAHVSPLYVARGIFALAVSLTFGFTFVKIDSLISKRPESIRGIANVYFWGSVLFALVAWYYGNFPNIIGLIVQTCIYISLLRAADRVLNAVPEEKAEQAAAAQRP